MNVKELLSKLTAIVNAENINLDADVIVGFYDKIVGITDLNITGVDWLFESSDDVGLPNYERKKVIEIKVEEK